MARIRTIKPEFWADEKLSHLSAVDRLVFLGLISMADDYGRLHDNVKIIDAFVFPNTDDTVRESLANLSRMNRIRRGKSSQGMPVIEIVNWEKHQKVDKPQPKLALPAIATKTNENAGQNVIREPFANDSRTGSELVAPHTTDQDQDQRPTTPSRSGSKRAHDEVKIPNALKEHWERWTLYIEESQGKRIGTVEAETTLKSLMDRGVEKAKQDIEFSIVKRCKTIRDSSNDYDKRQNGRQRELVKDVPF